MSIVIQLQLLPRLCARFGEHVSCAAGLLTLGLAFGLCSVVRSQPGHALLFLASRTECTERWGESAFDAAEARAGYSLGGGLASPRLVGAFGVGGGALLVFCLACGLVYGF